MILLISLLSLTAKSQITFEKYYGGIFDEYGHSVLQTNDNGYIICGNTTSFGAGGEDVYVIKTDEMGSVQWIKTYGGSNQEHGYFISPINDNCFIVAAEYNNYSNNISQAYILKINALGDTIWTKKYSGLNTAIARCVFQTNDSNYILCGATRASSSVEYDGFLMKITEAGDIIWAKTFGGTGRDWFYDLKQTTDGGYIMCGATNSFGNGTDFYVVKTNVFGDSLWTRHYDLPKYNASYSIIQNNDGSFFIGGVTVDATGFDIADIQLIKINSIGDTIWTKKYGGSDSDNGCSLAHSSDNGIIVCGWTESFGSGNSDIYLFKIDSAGTMLWSQTFGGNNYEVGYSVQETSDFGFILVGYTQSFGAGEADIYMIKTDSEGVVTWIEDEYNTDLAHINIYPNPNRGNFFIDLPIGETQIEIINQFGIVLKTNYFITNSPTHHKEIDISNLSKGIYFLRIINDNEVKDCQKLVIN